MILSSCQRCPSHGLNNGRGISDISNFNVPGLYSAYRLYIVLYFLYITLHVSDKIFSSIYIYKHQIQRTSIYRSTLYITSTKKNRVSHPKTPNKFLRAQVILQEINISHLGKRKIIDSNMPFLGGYVSSLEGTSTQKNPYQNRPSQKETHLPTIHFQGRTVKLPGHKLVQPPKNPSCKRHHLPYRYQTLGLPSG